MQLPREIFPVFSTKGGLISISLSSDVGRITHLNDAEYLIQMALDISFEISDTNKARYLIRTTLDI